MKRKDNYDASAESRNASRRDMLDRFVANKMAVIGTALMILMILAVIFLPIILQLDPYTSDYEAGFSQAPSSEHILGTDTVGRDNFARLVYGGRVSLSVGLLSTLLSMLIGVPLGLLAGFYRGWVETVIMRLVDIFMSIPSMMLILVLVSIVGPSASSIVVVLGLLGWTGYARLIHGKVLSVREEEYVESARAIGTRNLQIVTKYILPNSFAPCIISMTYGTASSILTEASLSFLGMGVQPPTASWGNIIYAAQSVTVLSTQPWAWIPPGICLVITVLSINFFGNGLRDALDPKMKV